MKLSEILERKEDGYYSKWIPTSMNQSSVMFKLFDLGEVPEDGWEKEREEMVGSYPSGTAEWTYYINDSANAKKFRKQSGSGYRFGDLAERVR